MPDQCQTDSYVPGASVICVLKYLLTYLLSLHGDPRSMLCNASCLQLFYASGLDACVCLCEFGLLTKIHRIAVCSTYYRVTSKSATDD